MSNAAAEAETSVDCGVRSSVVQLLAEYHHAGPTREFVVSDGVRAIGIDHIVLNVSDIETALAFYCSGLGMAPVRVEEWRRGECAFPSARASESFIIDFGTGPRPVGANLNHFCLLVEETDFERVANGGHFRIKSGPTTNYGARGTGYSIKVLDPDDNTVELRYYSSDPVDLGVLSTVQQPPRS